MMTRNLWGLLGLALCLIGLIVNWVSPALSFFFLVGAFGWYFGRSKLIKDDGQGE